MTPTPAQKRVLDFIESYIERTGMSPTFREIGDALGMKSLSTVHQHVMGLRRRGLLEISGNLKRSIRLLYGKQEIASRQIVCVYRASDCKAYFADNPAKWEAGDTCFEALGKLVLSHQRELGLSIRVCSEKGVAA